VEAFGEKRCANGERFVVVPKMSPIMRGYLPLVARIGSLNEEDLKTTLQERHTRYEFDLDISKFVRVERTDIRRAFLDILAGGLQGVLKEEEAQHALILPEV
jgi:hypothetical protein